MTSMWDDLKIKIKTLNETIWENNATWPHVEQWLNNFKADAHEMPSERLHALFLLSQFMYFGSRQLRELIRRANADTTDRRLIGMRFVREVRATRFLGIGNPSESGTHLLYLFRQENSLPKNLFVNTHEIFTRSSAGDRTLRDSRIVRYVFLDDLCGSGTQAQQYSKDVLRDLKALDSTTRACYYALFATQEALATIRTTTLFDDVRCVVELDPSFKCFGAESRYFSAEMSEINKAFAEAVCLSYGLQLVPSHPLGFRDSQLMIGFHHNTPDNTLPLFWCDKPGARWRPIFKRYPKWEW